MFHQLIKNGSRLSVAIAVALSMAACSHGGDETGTPPPAFTADHGVYKVPDGSPLRKELVVQPVEMHQAPHAKIFPANVEADPTRTANVLPPLTGKVMELKVGLGDHVTRGQLLAVIDSGDLAQAYADVYKAKDALDLAKKTLDRARAVKAAGGNAVKDLEAAQSGYNQALYEFNRAQTRLPAVGGTQGAEATRPMQITAPATGYITALTVAPGTYVNDPTASMMTISDLSSVWITSNVPESDVAQVTKGEKMSAVLTAYPNEVFHGKVTFVNPVIQPDTRRDLVRAVFANPDARLKPNMYANVSIDTPQPDEVFVPQSALLMNNDSITVFVEVSPWTFERRTVDLSYDENDGTRVLKGLKAGDRVIVRGGVLLND
ncbi:efflux RND transporter periplasmic adaptor subunit [Dyella caseinilytica]|uniref:Efflux RND transporter periplasmic adaptor subunit n=1 Tax=Dyella caseinilytica TaxID=1849581 RepID=A0ABX7GVI2_9GAMM|nr:efflux RND transporter periplasmic adaptor subunit [Dyella caseinilytica]QRN54073.1 efflux RND transporter periplasmic adaptor subunit [Dyella caseinilytica]GFZ91387.1 RND transporter [Dyella caseinilytica]